MSRRVVHFGKKQTLMVAVVVMILRLWAMYNRSKLILRVFLPLFSLELISSILCAAFYSDPRILPGLWMLAELMIHCTNPLSTPTPFVRHHTGDTIQIFDLSLCVWLNHLPSMSIVNSVLRVTHGTALCIFAIAQLVRQSKQWQPNRYMNLLVKQGILYFI